jgi:hypothetical protein
MAAAARGAELVTALVVPLVLLLLPNEKLGSAGGCMRTLAVAEGPLACCRCCCGCRGGLAALLPPSPAIGLAALLPPAAASGAALLLPPPAAKDAMVESMWSIKLDTTSEKLSLLSIVSCLLVLLAPAPMPLLLPAPAPASGAGVRLGWGAGGASTPPLLLLLLVSETVPEEPEAMAMPACRCS